MRDLLTVLLNEPRHFDQAADEFDPDLCRDDKLKAIARALCEALQGDVEEFSIARFIGRFDEPELAGCITDLQIAGERRGNHEAIVEGALRCLRNARERVVYDRLVAAAKRRGGQDQAPTDGAREATDTTEADSAGDELAAARELVERVRSSGHFAARRHLAVPRTGDAGGS
jgi:hypothetical protein